MWLNLKYILFAVFLVLGFYWLYIFMVKRFKKASVRNKKFKTLRRISRTYSKSKTLLILLVPLILSACCAKNTQPIIRNGIVIHPTSADVNNISDSLAKQILENNAILEK